MQTADHFLFMLAVVLSAYLYASGRAVARLLSAEGVSRAAIFLQSFVSMLGLTGLVLGLWWFSGRPWEEIGLGGAAWNWEDPGFRLAFWISCALIAGLAGSTGLVALGVIPHAWMRRYYGYIAFLMPRRRREWGMSLFASMTAGLGEETLYRGFVFWYLGTAAAALLGAGPAAVACGLAGSSVLFGLAHGYQGPKGLLITTVVGLAFGGLFWLGGSLPLLILLHTAIDWASFTAGYIVFRGRGVRPPDAPPEPLA
jgi:membrane protease YdiL (CAAX protease family)